MAGDHDDRRRLARTALAEGWTVRRTEAEARAPSEAHARRRPGPRRAAARSHPDQEAAASRLGEAFGRALGADVQVTRRGAPGYKVALTFDSLDEALELAVADRHRRAASDRRYHRPARAISSVG